MEVATPLFIAKCPRDCRFPRATILSTKDESVRQPAPFLSVALFASACGPALIRACVRSCTRRRIRHAGLIRRVTDER